MDIHYQLPIKTPSGHENQGVFKGLKIEKRSIGGVGEKSYRSEDEVFSDAVAEFSDSGISPGSEEKLEDVKELEKNVQRTVVDDDIYSTGTLKVDAVSGNISSRSQ